jgi:hypothetical protein
MSWSDQWYPLTLQALTGLRGEGARDDEGNQYPQIRSTDGIAILAQLSKPLASAIAKFLDGRGAIYQWWRDADGDGVVGSVTGDKILDKVWLANSDEISIEEYLGGYGLRVSREPWIRTPNATAAVESNDGDKFATWSKSFYQPMLNRALLGGEEDALLHQIRSAVARWDDGVGASALCIDAAGVDKESIANDENTIHFFTAVRSLCVAIDLLHENPPDSTIDKVTAAAEHALERSADAIGRGAAYTADLAGRTAGTAVEGFLGTASLTSIVVAGLAVYLLV